MVMGFSRYQVLRSGSPFPSSRGHPGTVQLAQGHPGWLFSPGGTAGNRTPNLWLCEGGRSHGSSTGSCWHLMPICGHKPNKCVFCTTEHCGTNNVARNISYIQSPAFIFLDLFINNILLFLQWALNSAHKAFSHLATSSQQQPYEVVKRRERDSSRVTQCLP